MIAPDTSSGVVWRDMGSSGQITTELDLAEEAVFGLLMALSGGLSVPARPWPVAAACRSLASGREPISAAIRDVAAHAGEVGGEHLIERWLVVLAGRGNLHPNGRGISAAWALDQTWLAGWRLFAAALPAEEQPAWARAVQSFARCRSIWEKAARAASTGSTSSPARAP